MRIAVVHLGRRGSGGPISLELAVHLRTSAEVFAVVSRFAENVARWRDTGIDLIEVETYRNPAQALLSWIDRRRLAAVAQAIADRRPDVLLFPMFHTWMPFLISRLRPTPAIVMVHDPTPHPGLLAQGYRWLEDASLRRAARCIVLSSGLKRHLERRGVSEEKIRVVPHGELSYYRRVGKSAPEKHSSGTTLLFFGRITRYKGLEVLLEAVHAMSATRKIQLEIAGEGSLRPWRRWLERMPNVRINNRWIPEEEVASIFSRASIVVLPYSSASQSGVIPIAASFGLPVIASNVGGIPEQIRHEETGLLIEPHSSKSLQQAIERLLGDPALGARLGERLRQEYASRYSWDRIAGEVHRVCEEALAFDLAREAR